MVKNLEQYQLQDRFLGVIRFDMAKNDLFVPRPIFDAIITDRSFPSPSPLLTP